MPTLRRFVLVTGGLFIVLGPAYQQVFERESPYLRSWRMYFGPGINYCSVAYYAKGAERYERITARPVRNHRRTFVINSVEQAKTHGKALCQKLGTDIRMHLRCPSKRGWQTVATPDEELCDG